MLSEEELKEQMKKLLSTSDFGRYIENAESKVIKFSDLENYDNIYDLLTEWLDFRIILIESQKNSGHWVAMVRCHNDFCFFDSYGYNPIQNLNFISKSMNKLLGQEISDFSNLFKKLKKGTFELEYNKKKFQKVSPDINTCGRWCIIFISKWLLGYSLKEFQLFIENQKKESGYSYDEIITLLSY
jgi:hypothetical protein